MIKGACPGVKRRVITLRKTLFPQTSRSALEEIKLKFIGEGAAAAAAAAAPPARAWCSWTAALLARFARWLAAGARAPAASLPLHALLHAGCP